MRINPRVRVSKHGMATLAGIPVADLYSILTMASLRLYDDKEDEKRKAEEAEKRALSYEAEGSAMMAAVVRRNIASDIAWRRRMRAIVDEARDNRKRKREGMRSLATMEPLEVERRRKEAEGDRAFRLKMRAMFAERRAAKV